MARGWESKSIEAQQEENVRQKPLRRSLSPDELARAERRHSLELTRARMVDDLGRASAPAHRTMLEQAIATLDEQIASLT
jgi:hypothetical protein